MHKRFRPLPALLAALLAPYAFAQSPPAATADGGRLAFVGDTTRAGIGWDSDNRLRGELWHVLREDDRSAWIGELWATDRTAGGAKLSYHWRPDGAGADDGVRKAFAAFDQNRWHDRKITLGAGYERPDWFASAHVSAGVTGRREVAVESTSSTSTIRGDDNGRPFEQDVTTTLLTRTFERAYDWGVGGRYGHFYAGPMLRLEAGLDYERGRGGTGQATVAIGAEKFFEGAPYSIAVVGEAYRKHGGIEPDRDDGRVWIMLRYALGGATSWRAERPSRMVEVPRPASPATPVPATPTPPAVVATPAPTPPTPPVPAQPRVEKRIVKTTATASADAFFDLDSAVLRPQARAALDAAIARIRASGFEGNIRIAGHTCDLGPAAYNLRLSQRRAAAVRDHLVAQGLPADRLLAEGLGETAPRFPNTRETRPKNRRVDIEFVTFEDRVETVTLPPPPPAAPTTPVAAATAPPALQVPPPAPAQAPVEWRRGRSPPSPRGCAARCATPRGTSRRSTSIAAGPRRPP
jgi:outer membrane protein OmpA-like peptidoglycan-associated protein